MDCNDKINIIVNSNRYWKPQSENYRLTVLKYVRNTDILLLIDHLTGFGGNHFMMIKTLHNLQTWVWKKFEVVVYVYIFFRFE